jgi:hypothetical protein
MIASINLATAVLAVRLILLLAVCGGIFLAWMALADAVPLKLGALGLYTLTVLLPLVWLSARHP